MNSKSNSKFEKLRSVVETLQPGSSVSVVSPGRVRIFWQSGQQSPMFAGRNTAEATEMASKWLLGVIEQAAQIG